MGAWGRQLREMALPVLNPAAYVESLVRKTHEPFSPERLLGDIERKSQAMFMDRVHHGLSGDQRSLFKGQGLDFAELREYNPGDDIRKMDWQVFARTQVPHIREYQEERQVRIWVALEWSLALALGSSRFCFENSEILSNKANRSFELALLLTHLAQQVKARIGAYYISPLGHGVLPPATGIAQQRKIVAQMHAQYPRRWDHHQLTDSFAPLQRMVLKQDWVLLLADASRLTQEWAAPLGDLAQRAHVSIFAIYDREEFQPPDVLCPLQLQCPSQSNNVVRYIKANDTNQQVFEDLLKSRLGKFEGIGQIVPVCVQDDVATAVLQWNKLTHKSHLAPSSLLNRGGRR